MKRNMIALEDIFDIEDGDILNNVHLPKFEKKFGKDVSITTQKRGILVTCECNNSVEYDDDDLKFLIYMAEMNDYKNEISFQNGRGFNRIKLSGDFDFHNCPINL